jgi:DNA repair protein RecO (recombination protein O)
MLKRQDAIILKNYDYRNSSKIIHILSSDSQRLSLIAKGARSTKSRFAGNIEPMNLTQLVYYIKQGKSLGTLKEATLIQSHPSLKKDLYRLNIGWSLIWMGKKIPSPMDGLFGLEKRALSFLDRGFKEEVFAYFFLSLFTLEGIPPQMEKCSSCGSKELHYFDIETGGSRCKNCVTSKATLFTPLATTLKDLKKGRFHTWEEIEEKEKQEILDFILKYSIYHLGDWVKRITDILPFAIKP